MINIKFIIISKNNLVGVLSGFVLKNIFKSSFFIHLLSSGGDGDGLGVLKTSFLDFKINFYCIKFITDQSILTSKMSNFSHLETTACLLLYYSDVITDKFYAIKVYFKIRKADFQESDPVTAA
jgi:hypothetical protein